MSGQWDNCFRCHISGQVQGVFFRDSTQTKAKQLGLAGFVRNRTDGSVEVYACGPDAQLDALKEWLQQGPSKANVTAVNCKRATWEHFDGFEVR